MTLLNLKKNQRMRLDSTHEDRSYIVSNLQKTQQQVLREHLMQVYIFTYFMYVY